MKTSKPSEPTATAAAAEQYLTFQLQSHAYGVNVRHINSLLDSQEVTPIMQQLTLITGLANVRGSVVPVFNPCLVLAGLNINEVAVPAPAAIPAGAAAATDKLEGQPASWPAGQVLPSNQMEDADGGLIIFEIANGTLLPFIGMAVDRIGKVVALSASQLLAVPSFLPDTVASHLEGFCFVAGKRHTILRLEHLVSGEVLFGEGQGRDDHA
ncbi:MAG: hypothetical protein A2004_05965 [Spirochaetes bacterium GWC1_61_12]|nr:MAG: hypothetical protein A2004_05965 [Spirochaetes bacterium GWC1_61_12]OHD41899.1 MAG: hypothetical protein A2Y35_04560 [Spirochaetes bacterium GWE1_60_18]